MYPNLRGHYDDLQFSVPDAQRLGACDVVFFATPHGVAHALAGELLDAGTRVIDLSADFRLADAEEWARWYGQPHGAPALLDEAVYGLPEVNREKIRQARLIAVPGCYPTATQLGLIPLLEAGLADASRLIADCKSGVSGAGRGAKVGSLFCEAGESMMAYAVRASASPGNQPGPAPGLRRRGRADVRTAPDANDPRYPCNPLCPCRGSLGRPPGAVRERYADEPFVDVMPAGSHPETRSVRGANVCRIAVHRPQGGDLVVVLSVIDNLVKGASGQALQNMNILFGLDERLGLACGPAP